MSVDSRLTEISQPHYYAVIFTSIRAQENSEYDLMAQKMSELVRNQNGFIGMESARNRNGFGITISFWDNLDSILQWKNNVEHKRAQILGKETWYKEYRVRVCKVEREYSV
ncbi:MAG: antibiotic biosynthesis monooxygenase family protein [Bdellovibrio sp.]